MPSITSTVIQSGIDVLTYVAIDTNLSADGKAAWSIKGLRGYFQNGYTANPALDWTVSAIIGTTNDDPDFGDPQIMDFLNWSSRSLGASLVGFEMFEAVQEHVPMEERITVQPIIYLSAKSINTGQANTLIMQVFYDVVKLSDLEVLRLLAGGA